MFQFLAIRKRQRPTKRRLAAEPLEARRVLAASLGWDGPGLGSAELSYYVANSPASLSQAETAAAIETALAAWSSAVDITFLPTDQPGLRDSIDITFTSIDGVGGTLAQAYFPDDVNSARIAGDIQFDISDAWEVGNSLGDQAFDLVYVAVHEIGHSLGLDHASLLACVLAPFVSPSQSFSSLDAVDVAAIQSLYAAADGVTTTETPVDEIPVEATPTDETLNDQTDTGDTDDAPFPRWRRVGGGNRNHWGGRLDAEAPKHNYVNPTDVNGDGNTSALDALTIINQLNGASSSVEGEDTAGLCDANGDGAVTALDALTVINALNNSSTAVFTAEDDTATTVGGNVVDEVDDSIDESTDTETPVTEIDDTVDAADEAGEVESPNDDGEVDDTDDTDLDVDLDVTDDVDESDVEFCNGGLYHQSGVVNVGLFRNSAETLISRYDTDEDGLLDETEVGERFWNKISTADFDSGAAVSVDEWDRFLAEEVSQAIQMTSDSLEWIFRLSITNTQPAARSV